MGNEVHLCDMTDYKYIKSIEKYYVFAAHILNFQVYSIVSHVFFKLLHIHTLTNQ